MIDEDTRVKILDKQVTEKVEKKFKKSSKNQPDFFELNNATKKETKEVQLNNEPPEVLKVNEDE